MTNNEEAPRALISFQSFGVVTDVRLRAETRYAMGHLTPIMVGRPELEVTIESFGHTMTYGLPMVEDPKGLLGKRVEVTVNVLEDRK